MNALHLNISPAHIDYRYGEKHILNSIARVATGDHQPVFGKVVTCDCVEYAIDFKLSRNTRLALRAQIYGADAVVEYTTIRTYVDVPERYVVRFVQEADVLPTDAVFKTTEMLIFDKDVFSQKIIAPHS